MRQIKRRLVCLLAMTGALAMAPLQAAQPVLFQGSYYQYVPTLTTWDVAKAQAYAMSYEGLPGRLVTLTSAAEQAFVASLVPANGLVMLGGSDAAQEGTWVWQTGPERGQIFWQDGAPYGTAYNPWRPGEPNAFFATEDYLVMYQGRWNDSAANDFLHSGYVVEYRSEAHGFDFAMSADHLGAVRNLSPTDHLVRLDIRLAGDTFFDSARSLPGQEFTAWSVIAASAGATWTLPDSAATDGLQTATLQLDLAPGQALHLQVDLDRLANGDGDGDGIAPGTQLTAWFSDGDVSYAVSGVVQAGAMTVLGTGFAYSAHSITAVPEPATPALWLGGLLVTALVCRARCRPRH